MEPCGSNVAPLFTRPNAGTWNQQLVAPINGTPLYMASTIHACYSVPHIQVGKVEATASRAAAESWRSLNVMVLLGYLSHDGVCPLKRPASLFQWSAAFIGHHLHTLLNVLFIFVPMMSHSCLQLQIKDLKSCLNFHCNHKTVYATADLLTQVVLYSAFHF